MENTDLVETHGLRLRTPNGNDYGMDLLRRHYETAHHSPHDGR
jgi:hypothetical protein